MSKIDWTKPIETVNGHPAILLTVLNYPDYPHVVVLTHTDGKEHMVRCNEDGCIPLASLSFIRNVAPPLRLYGRLEPWKPGDIEGLGWTPHQGKSDTHVIELTSEDLKRVMRPLSAQEYHDA